MAHYSIEALIVGIITMVIGTVLSVLSMYLQPGFSIKQIDFWGYLLAVNFLTGFITHLLCECVGLNKWYCKNGYACKN